MQIEFIGCTSAGKSTLAKKILHQCREQGLDMVPGDDFVLKQFRLNRINSRPLRKLLVNLVGVCACLVTWRKYNEVCIFATRLLFQLPIPLLEKVNLLRNVLKKIGIYEFIRFYNTNQQIVLVDEGALQTAHNLFVHRSGTMKTKDLSTFAGLIPVPDVIIYLRQPDSLLIDRIMERGHKRIPDRSYESVNHFVKQAVTTFDKLAQYPIVATRILIVDGSQNIVLSINQLFNELFQEFSIGRDKAC